MPEPPTMLTCQSRLLSQSADWAKDGKWKEVVICLETACGLVLAEPGEGGILSVISLDGIVKVARLSGAEPTVVIHCPHSTTCFRLKEGDDGQAADPDQFTDIISEFRVQTDLPPIATEVSSATTYEEHLALTSQNPNQQQQYHIECTIPMEKAMQDGKPRLGLNMKAEANRVYIAGVASDGPAQDAGVQPDSVLLAVCGQKVTTRAEVATLVTTALDKGEPIKLRLLSPHPPVILVDPNITTTTTTGKRSATPTPSNSPHHIECVILPEKAKQRIGMNMRAEENRVLVSDVVPGSAADEAGVQPDSVLTSVCGKKVTTRGEVQEILKESIAKDEPIKLRLVSPHPPISSVLIESMKAARATPPPPVSPMCGKQAKRALLIYTMKNTTTEVTRDMLQVYWSLCGMAGKENVAFITNAPVTGDVAAHVAAPTRDNIMKGLAWLSRAQTPVDPLLLILAGQAGSQCGVVPIDTSSGISNEEIMAAFATLPPSQHLTVITDTPENGSLGHSYDSLSTLSYPKCMVTILGSEAEDVKKKKKRPHGNHGGLDTGLMSCCYATAQQCSGGDRTPNFMSACMRTGQSLLVTTNFPCDMNISSGQVHIGSGWYKMRFAAFAKGEFPSWMGEFSQVYCAGRLEESDTVMLKAGKGARVVRKMMKTYQRCRRWLEEPLSKMTKLLHSALSNTGSPADEQAVYEVIGNMLSQHVWDDTLEMYADNYEEDLRVVLESRLSDPEIEECKEILSSYGVLYTPPTPSPHPSTTTTASSMSTASSRSSLAMMPPLPSSPPPIVVHNETGTQDTIPIRVSKQRPVESAGVKLRKEIIEGVEKGSVPGSHGVRRGMVVIGVDGRRIVKGDDVGGILEGVSNESFDMVVGEPVGGLPPSRSSGSVYCASMHSVAISNPIRGLPQSSRSTTTASIASMHSIAVSNVANELERSVSMHSVAISNPAFDLEVPKSISSAASMRSIGISNPADTLRSSSESAPSMHSIGLGPAYSILEDSEESDDLQDYDRVQSTGTAAGYGTARQKTTQRNTPVDAPLVNLGMGMGPGRLPPPTTPQRQGTFTYGEGSPPPPMLQGQHGHNLSRASIPPASVGFIGGGDVRPMSTVQREASPRVPPTYVREGPSKEEEEFLKLVVKDLEAAEGLLTNGLPKDRAVHRELNKVTEVRLPQASVGDELYLNSIPAKHSYVPRQYQSPDIPQLELSYPTPREVPSPNYETMSVLSMPDEHTWG